jgi:segregation and condensation protein B
MPENAATSERTELDVPSTLKALIEAMIFAAQEPLSIAQIKAIYQDGRRSDEDQQLEPETVRKIVADLNREYERSDRPYRILQIAGGYQFGTLASYAAWIGKLYKEQGRRKLSQSGVETLCLVAYKQPITKSEIERIRGVNCDYVLKTLLEKELVTVTGRAETVGRPLLYGTTKEFLKHFGLNEIVDLPRPREIEEILGESQFETERRMLEAQAGADQMKKEQEDFKSRLPHIPKKKPDLEQQGVEIVSRNVTKDIKVIATSDRISDHEQIEEAAGPAPGISSIADDAELGKIESTTFQEKQGEPDGPSFAQDKQSTQNAGHAGQSAGEGREDAESDSERAGSPFAASQAVEPAKTAGADQPGAGSAQIQSRWKLWREKVKDFIKNLFG